jgi:hypothetical protein
MRFYFGDEPFQETRTGFREWKENLAWAWKHNRKILIIEVVKLSPKENSFWPNKDSVMRLLAFNEDTGAFLAREERV